MNKHLYRAAGGAGLLAIAWVAAGYLRTHPLALVMTLLMGGFYLMGVLELQRYQKATEGLNRALGALAAPPESPAALSDWLALVPAPLRNAVRLRVDGERSPLPGPTLAPYLAGLLVLLGMLGTFVGMVVTLNGTGLALQQATDVQAMRESLAAPVRGLGLAFGTSVAGVAASAMLGLMSALCRHARQQAGQLLDTHTATTLLTWSRSHLHAQQRRQEREARDRLQQTRHDESLQLAQRQLAHQQAFQGQALQAYSALATSMAQTLQDALQNTMQGLGHQTAALQQQVAHTVQQQLHGFAQRFEEQSSTWVLRMATHLQQQQAALLHTLGSTQAEQHAQQQAQHHAQQKARDDEQRAAWNAATTALLSTLQQTSSHISEQAETQARSTIAEVTRLVHSAAEAPRAAGLAMADVVTQLRQQLSDGLVRDNTMLEERSHIMATLNTLLGAVQHTSTEQKAAIDQMVASTASWLQQASERFTVRADAETARLETVSAQLACSAVDVASLGEAFGTAVELFIQSNGQMMKHLHRLEAALGKSSARGDEQLAYYVAQAREVIDLSLLSQKQIVDDLQRLGPRPPGANHLAAAA